MEQYVIATSSHNHTTPILKSLHWLPVASHVQFKVLLLTYKALIGLSPLSILELLNKYCPRCQLRSRNRLLPSASAVSTVTYGQRSSVCPFCQHCYLWSTFFCLSLLSTLLPMVNVLLSAPAINTVIYDECSSVCTCCQHCYLRPTFSLLAAPQLWNSLPEPINNLQTSKLKTFYSLNFSVITKTWLKVFDHFLLLLSLSLSLLLIL